MAWESHHSLMEAIPTSVAMALSTSITALPPCFTTHDAVRQDLNSKVMSKFFISPNLLDVAIDEASKTIETFQNEFNGRPQDGGFMGLS